MDVITSLSIYREALISSIWTLDAFPVELQAFSDKERRLLEGMVKSLEADIRFHRDRDYSFGPRFLIYNNHDP